MKRAAGFRRVARILAAIGAAAFGVVAYVYLTLPDVRPLARTNPTTTAFMELRAREARAAGRPLRKANRWVPYSRISRNLTRAVLVAEDAAFWDHQGIDLAEIRKSIEIAFEQGGEIRGASTITQQLAKNLYLSPSRDPLRKLRELIIARRLETALSKARIFELYLNLVEWGPGIWGAEAAARTYFGVPASALTREQAALLAGALINPIVYSPARPPARLLRRQRIILSRMGIVEPPPPIPLSAPPPASQADAESDAAFSPADAAGDDAPPPDEPGTPALPQPDAPAEPVPQPFPTPESSPNP
jgi:monofunctional biosynthetic peptidoglycan transglycosylase